MLEHLLQDFDYKRCKECLALPEVSICCSSDGFTVSRCFTFAWHTTGVFVACMPVLLLLLPWLLRHLLIVLEHRHIVGFQVP